MKYHAGWVGAICCALVLAGCESKLGGNSKEQAASESHSNSPKVAKGHLRFVEGFQKGYAQAAKESKPMLVFFTAEWCHFCHQLADEAFTNPQVVSLSENFVCVLVDADAEPSVCRQFGVTGFPTIQFLSPRGGSLERIVGKKPGHQLMMAMQAALQNVARHSAASDAPSR